MTMFAYIFVVGCAYALTEGKSDARPYAEAMEMTQKVVEVLQQNVLSMASGIPLLDDPRRHYAELVFTVFQQTDSLTVCSKKDYDGGYAKVLNMTAALAILEPQMVVDKTAELVDLIMAKTVNIRSLIDNQCNTTRSEDCDHVINAEVNADPERYEGEAAKLLFAGRTAAKFMELEPTFSRTAKDHAAHKYVVEGQQDLKGLVLAAVDMMSILKPTDCWLRL